MENVKEIFREHGISGEPKMLSGGWTNEVWAAGGAVLRLSKTVGSDKLRREAAIGRALPSDVGYPRIIAEGFIGECEYMLAVRLEGTNLDDAWDSLSGTERISAAKRLLELAEIIHETQADAAEDAWYFIPEWQKSILIYEETGVYARDLAARLLKIAERFDAARRGCKRVFCHGDLTLANVMWHAGKITGVLDFECAARAPRELDALCVINETIFRADAEYARDLKKLVAPMGLNRDILVGYAAMKAQKHLSFDIENGGEQLARLNSLAEDGGGYLEGMFE